MSILNVRSLQCIGLIGAMLAFVTPGQGAWVVLGVGSDSCGKFLSAATGVSPGKGRTVTIEGRKYVDDMGVYAEWINGALTTANMFGQESKQITTDHAGVDLWLRKWCEAHPANSLMEAVAAFVRDRTG